MQNGFYSATELLAKSLLLGGWRKGWWCLLTAYLDESCTDEGHRFPVIAGFLGHTKTWMAFERQWNRYASGNKRADRKDTNLARIAAESNIFPIYMGIDRIAFASVLRNCKARSPKTSEPMIKLWSNAYGACSYMCCQLLDGTARRLTVPPDTRIKVVFDDGNPDKRTFELAYRKYRAQKRDSYLSDVPLFENDRSLPPLQAADLYAYALSRFWNRGVKTEAYKLIHESHRVQSSGKLLDEDALNLLVNMAKNLR